MLKYLNDFCLFKAYTRSRLCISYGQLQNINRDTCLVPESNPEYWLVYKVHDYLIDRSGRKQLLFSRVMQMGSSSLLLGTIFGIAGNHIYPVPAPFLNELDVSGSVMLSVCLTIFSITPVDELDIDRELASYPAVRNLVGIGCMCGGVAAMFTRHLMIPSLVFLVALWIPLGGEQVYHHHRPRATTVLAVYMGVYYLVPSWTWELWEKIYQLFMLAAFSVCWLWQRRRFESCDNLDGVKSGWHPTLGLWISAYGCLSLRGSQLILLCIISINREGRLTYPYTLMLIAGVSLLLPLLLVVIYGRRAISSLLMRRFDHSYEAKDGEFLAELFLSNDILRPGSTVWLHHSLLKCKPAQPPPGTDPTRFPSWRHWWPANVIDMDDQKHRMLLELSNVPNSRIEVEDLFLTETLEDVIQNSEVRYIEWKDLTLETMSTKHSSLVGLKDLYSLSRPLGKGQKIDFFVSHSWRDNAMNKWQRLQALVALFVQKNGRPPTFWFDRFCLNHDRSTNSLKGLCVYINSCNSTLVLCGETYPHRLWCAWELFTIIAFQHEECIVSRLVVIPLDTTDDCPLESKSLDALTHFDVDNTHCYDPNDEWRLKSIISSVGCADFNEKFRKMAKKIIKMRFKDKRRTMKELKFIEPIPSEGHRMRAHVAQTTQTIVMIDSAVDDEPSRSP